MDSRKRLSPRWSFPRPSLDPDNTTSIDLHPPCSRVAGPPTLAASRLRRSCARSGQHTPRTGPMVTSPACPKRSARGGAMAAASLLPAAVPRATSWVDGPVGTASREAPVTYLSCGGEQLAIETERLLSTISKRCPGREIPTPSKRLVSLALGIKGAVGLGSAPNTPLGRLRIPSRLARRRVDGVDLPPQSSGARAGRLPYRTTRHAPDLSPPTEHRILQALVANSCKATATACANSGFSMACKCALAVLPVGLDRSRPRRAGQTRVIAVFPGRGDADAD